MQLIYKEDDFRSKCSISCTLDLIGDKWTLLIIRDALFLGSKNFGEFKSSPEKIASNILANRLEKLVKFGIMSKTQNSTNKLKFDYELTSHGRNLQPILMALGKWGYDHIQGTNDVVLALTKLRKNKIL